MESIIALFLKYLPTLVNAAKTVPEVVAYIKQTKATLETTQEWTSLEEAEFNKHVEAITSQPHWQPESNG